MYRINMLMSDMDERSADKFTSEQEIPDGVLLSFSEFMWCFTSVSLCEKMVTDVCFQADNCEQLLQLQITTVLLSIHSVSVCFMSLSGIPGKKCGTIIFTAEELSNCRVSSTSHSEHTQSPLSRAGSHVVLPFSTRF